MSCEMHVQTCQLVVQRREQTLILSCDDSMGFCTSIFLREKFVAKTLG